MKRAGTRWSATLFLTSLLILAGTALARDTNGVRAVVEPGVTTLLVSGQQVEVVTDARIVVTLTIEGGTIRGGVELALGTESAQVTITVLGNPNQVIFDGRVNQKQIFLRYLPGETGQGEM